MSEVDMGHGGLFNGLADLGLPVFQPAQISRIGEPDFKVTQNNYPRLFLMFLYAHTCAGLSSLFYVQGYLFKKPYVFLAI